MIRRDADINIVGVRADLPCGAGSGRTGWRRQIHVETAVGKNSVCIHLQIAASYGVDRELSVGIVNHADVVLRRPKTIQIDVRRRRSVRRIADVDGAVYRIAR